MNKEAYLRKLRELLSYELPERLVEKNVRFYSDYIDGQLRMGRRMEEVINDLGDPMLIAKTIVDAAKSGPDGIPGSGDDNDFTSEIYGNGVGEEPGSRSRFDEDGYGDANTYETAGNAGGDDRGFRPLNMTVLGTGSCLILILVFLFVLALLGAVLHFLSPILVPVILVLLIMSLFKGRN